MKVSQVSLPALLSDLCLLGGNLNCSFEWCIYLLIKLPTSVGSKKKQWNSRKTSTPASLTMLKSLCGSQQTVENSERDGNTRPPDLPPETSVCRSRSNS